MYCKHCGTPLEPNDTFCAFCGKPTAECTEEPASPNTQCVDTTQFPPHKLPQKLYPAETNTEAAATESSPAFSTTYPDTDANLDQPTLATAHSPISDALQQDSPVAHDTVEQQSVPGGKARYLTILLSAMGVLTAASLAFAIYTVSHTGSLRGQVRKAEAERSAYEQTIADQQSRITALEAELTSVGDDNSALSEKNDALSQTIASMENNVNQYAYDKENAELKLEQANAQISELNTTILGLQSDLTQAKTDYETLQSDHNALQSDYNTLSDENASNATKLDFFDSHVVFVNSPSTDKYYHKYDCSSFSRQRFLAYNTELAESNGYHPCPTCCGGTVIQTPTPSPSTSPGLLGTIFG